MIDQRPAGFTLVELLITVAVVAILVTVAVPSYSAFMLQSKRVDAMDSLQDLAGRQERYFSLHASYTADESEIGFAADGPQASAKGYFQVQVTAAGTLNYTLEATPVGEQTRDTVAIFQLDSTGRKRHRDTSGTWYDGWGE